jgi:hypothetical protein
MCHRVRFYKADKSVGHGFVWHFYLDPEETPEGEIAFRPVNRKARMAISVRTIMRVAQDILMGIPVPMVYSLQRISRNDPDTGEWCVEITEAPPD